jgi:hypothetical protein
MQFKPETIDAFQEDENQRASAFKIYVEAGIKPSIVAEMLGLELPEGTALESLDEKFNKPDPVPPQFTPANTTVTAPPQYQESTAPKSLDAQQIKDLDLWRQVAVRNYSKGKGKAEDFKCDSVPNDISDPIRERLKSADNELDVLKAFDIQSSRVEVFYDFSPILEAMRIEVEGLKHVPQPMSLTTNNEPGKAPVVNVSPSKSESPVIFKGR